MTSKFRHLSTNDVDQAILLTKSTNIKRSPYSPAAGIPSPATTDFDSDSARTMSSCKSSVASTPTLAASMDFDSDSTRTMSSCKSSVAAKPALAAPRDGRVSKRNGKDNAKTRRPAKSVGRNNDPREVEDHRLNEQKRRYNLRSSTQLMQNIPMCYGNIEEDSFLKRQQQHNAKTAGLMFDKTGVSGNCVYMLLHLINDQMCEDIRMGRKLAVPRKVQMLNEEFKRCVEAGRDPTEGTLMHDTRKDKCEPGADNKCATHGVEVYGECLMNRAIEAFQRNLKDFETEVRPPGSQVRRIVVR